MSHIVSLETQFLDLESLSKAAAMIGLEMVKQPTYKWFGKHVGDYPMPTGFTADDLGKCEFAIRIPGNEKAYEIGVVKRRDGQPGYTLLFDFWNDGYGLMPKVGNNCGKLTQEYAAQVAIKHAKKSGYSVTRKVTSDGKLQLLCR